MGWPRVFLKNELTEVKKGRDLALKEGQESLAEECRDIVSFLSERLAGNSPCEIPENIQKIGYALKAGFRKWFKFRLKSYQKKKRVLWRKPSRTKPKDKRSNEAVCAWRFLRNLGESTGAWEVARNEREDDDIDVRSLHKKTGRTINFQVTKYDPRAEEEFARFGLAVGGGDHEALIQLALDVIRGKINKCQTPGLILLLDWYMVTPRRIAALMEKRFRAMTFEKLQGIYIVCPRRNIVVKAPES
ncbi:MAG: hypothetical protein AAB091_02630 [Elusimicrobiota bacterium]